MWRRPTSCKESVASHDPRTSIRSSGTERRTSTDVDRPTSGNAGQTQQVDALVLPALGRGVALLPAVILGLKASEQLIHIAERVDAWQRRLTVPCVAERDQGNHEREEELSKRRSHQEREDKCHRE